MQDAYGLRAPRIDDALQRSLSLAYASLASVLLAMRSGPQGSSSATGSHVPWRDSPLTKWLRPQVHDASHIVVLATVEPGIGAAAETLATLNYVSRFRSLNAGGGVVVKPSWDAPGDANNEAHGRHMGDASLHHLCEHGSEDYDRYHNGDTGPHCTHTFSAEPLDSPRSLASDACCPAHAQQNSPVRAAPCVHSSPCSPGHAMAQQLQRRRQQQAATAQWRQQACSADFDAQASPRGAQEAQADTAAYEAIAHALRRAGGSLREQALLEQLLNRLASASGRVRAMAGFSYACGA